MGFRPLNFPQMWGKMSQTRPMAVKHSSTKEPRRVPKRNKDRSYSCKIFGKPIRWKELLELTYDNLGSSAPLVVFYAIGVVVGGIGSEGVSIAIVLAMVTSLLTGLCHIDLISSCSESSGNAVTAIYQLVGEFPSYLVATCYFLVTTSCFAALAKALSATIDELVRYKMSDFMSGIFGSLPLINLPPDFLASSIAITAAVLLACGLKQAEFLRAVMNGLTAFGLVLFVGIGALHIRSDSSNVEEIKPTTRQIIAMAGICCCLFYKFLQVGRTKVIRNERSVHLHLATVTLKTAVLVPGLALSILLPLMMDNRLPVSGAPLLRALQLRDLNVARFLFGAIQIIVIGLGLNEAGEAISRQLVTMASNGFLPSTLSQESSISFSHSKAHLFGGIWTAILAAFTTHVFLLEFFATNILVINITLVVITLYRPHRCAHHSLCTVAVTPSSNHFEAPNFMKNGFSYFPKRNGHTSEKHYETNELEIPLLSSLQSSEDLDCAEELNSKNLEDEEIGINLENSILQINGDVVTKNNLVPIFNNKEENSISNLYKTTSDNDLYQEEDIDSIIAEFKEQLRVSSKGHKISLAPTPNTARKSLIIVFLITMTFFILSCLILHESSMVNKTYKKAPESAILIIILIILAIIINLGLLLLLWRLPSLKSSQERIATYPIIPFFTLFLNVIFMTELFSRTLWLVLPLYIGGALWYILFVSQHSIATKHSYGKNTVNEEAHHHEMINLTPIATTTLCEVQPQSENHLFLMNKLSI